MAATKYQVLYRYMNSSMEIPITNDPNTAYKPTLEFYTDPGHRIFSDDPYIQNEEIVAQQAIITEANSADNPKNDMLFVYNGTARVPHPEWIDEIGYIVRDYQLVSRSDIGDRGDFSKLFTTLDKATCEDGGIVVCPARNMLRAEAKYPYTIHLNDLKYRNGRHKKFVTTSEEVQKIFIGSSVFKLKDEDWYAHISKTDFIRVNYQGTVQYCTGPIFVDCVPLQLPITPWGSSYSSIVWGLMDNYDSTEKIFSDIHRDIGDIETINIPGHYEDSPEEPYMIKDQYKRIENSPWIVNCTVGSLDAALEKAKKLIDMIGIENVKVIKLVAIDQFLKIK